MACYNNCYLPQPPRAWSRVQNSCTYLTEDVNAGAAYVAAAMHNKGNVLQYKANSSNLTKSQRYSQIAKGQWVNRNTTWAVQSTRGYTNPNSTYLKRTDGAINIAIDPASGTILGPTLEPVTCIQPINPVNPIVPPTKPDDSGSSEPAVPPNINPTPGSNVFPPLEPIEPLTPIVIQDGGSLLCSVQENVCTGETKQSLAQQLCHPTTDSDVPGPIEYLCWNDGMPTWYPKQRYVMSNSTDKWPINAPLFSSVKPATPYITKVEGIPVTTTVTVVQLIWTQPSNTCLPTSRFTIYENGQPIKDVLGSTFSTTITKTSSSNNYKIEYNYFIIAVANGGSNGSKNGIQSDPSNVVSIMI